MWMCARDVYLVRIYVIAIRVEVMMELPVHLDELMDHVTSPRGRNFFSWDLGC